MKSIGDDDDSLSGVGMPSGGAFSFGLSDFVIGNLTIGQTVPVTLTLPSALPAGSQYWIFNKRTKSWNSIDFTLDSSRTIVTFNLTDGDDRFDSDGLANGSIDDPGGFLVPSFLSSSSSGSSGGGGGGGGCYTIPVQGPGQGKYGSGRGFFGGDVILFLLLAYGVAGMLKRLKSRRATSDSLKL